MWAARRVAEKGIPLLDCLVRERESIAQSCEKESAECLLAADLKRQNIPYDGEEE
jgi:hypothetical protein